MYSKRPLCQSVGYIPINYFIINDYPLKCSRIKALSSIKWKYIKWKYLKIAFKYSTRVTVLTLVSYFFTVYIEKFGYIFCSELTLCAQSKPWMSESMRHTQY